jgi:hypothetical protein
MGYVDGSAWHNCTVTSVGVNEIGLTANSGSFARSFTLASDGHNADLIALATTALVNNKRVSAFVGIPNRNYGPAYCYNLRIIA